MDAAWAEVVCVAEAAADDALLELLPALDGLRAEMAVAAVVAQVRHGCPMLLAKRLLIEFVYAPAG